MKKHFSIFMCLFLALSSFLVSCGDSKNDPYNGHEYVDLGLPSGIKWATCNVGATKPEEFGGYYAWGETEEKSNYDWSTYKWYNISSFTWTKYYTDSDYDKVDYEKVLDSEDDVAHVKWGGSWRMPTKEDIEELCYVCDWEWTTQNGVNGHKVTGPNGNSIFLPAAGFRSFESLRDAGSYGNYCSATPISNSYGAYGFSFGSDGYDWSNGGYRVSGISVRPVSE